MDANKRKTIANLTLAGLLIGLGGRATAYETVPYQGIPARNVFDLKPPPARKVLQPPPPAVFRPKLTLTGITTILGWKIAFLTVPSATPAGIPEFLTLTEGQAHSDIEIIQINENAGVVKIINHGETQSLDFNHNGPPTSPPVQPSPTPSTPALESAAPPLTQEEQIAVIELQRVRLQQEGDPTFRILPPTPLTDEFEDTSVP